MRHPKPVDPWVEAAAHAMYMELRSGQFATMPWSRMKREFPAHHDKWIKAASAGINAYHRKTVEDGW